MCCFRVRASAYTSGTLNVAILPSSQYAAATSAVTFAAAMPAGNSRIGTVSAAGIHFVESTTAPNASATVTGTSRDVLAVASGSVVSTGYPTEVRLSSLASHAGTLYLEVSNDNATWFRIKQQAAAQNVASGLFIAEIAHKPTHRYARAVYINGATTATSFSLNTLLVA